MTNADPAVLAHERRLLTSVLGELQRHADPALGSLFLASSAGGVYAGASGHAFDEDTEPVALSAYGHAKLALEPKRRGSMRAREFLSSWVAYRTCTDRVRTSRSRRA